jgi:hypothetical protein
MNMCYVVIRILNDVMIGRQPSRQLFEHDVGRSRQESEKRESVKRSFFGQRS